MTKGTKCNIFLISESLNGITKIPIQTFISSNYETAKLYFQDYIKDRKNKIKFQLYKIGEINKDFKIEQTKIFITAGFEIENEISKQQKLREEREIIKKASQEEISEAVRTLFNGIYIND